MFLNKLCTYKSMGCSSIKQNSSWARVDKEHTNYHIWSLLSSFQLHMIHPFIVVVLLPLGASICIVS